MKLFNILPEHGAIKTGYYFFTSLFNAAPSNIGGEFVQPQMVSTSNGYQADLSSQFNGQPTPGSTPQGSTFSVKLESSGPGQIQDCSPSEGGQIQCKIIDQSAIDQGSTVSVKLESAGPGQTQVCSPSETGQIQCKVVTDAPAPAPAAEAGNINPSADLANQGSIKYSVKLSEGTGNGYHSCSQIQGGEYKCQFIAENTATQASPQVSVSSFNAETQCANSPSFASQGTCPIDATSPVSPGDMCPVEPESLGFFGKASALYWSAGTFSVNAIKSAGMTILPGATTSLESGIVYVASGLGISGTTLAVGVLTAGVGLSILGAGLYAYRCRGSNTPSSENELKESSNSDSTKKVNKLERRNAGIIKPASQDKQGPLTAVPSQIFAPSKKHVEPSKLTSRVERRNARIIKSANQESQGLLTAVPGQIFSKPKKRTVKKSSQSRDIRNKLAQKRKQESTVDKKSKTSRKNRLKNRRKSSSTSHSPSVRNIEKASFSRGKQLRKLRNKGNSLESILAKEEAKRIEEIKRIEEAKRVEEAQRLQEERIKAKDLQIQASKVDVLKELTQELERRGKSREYTKDVIKLSSTPSKVKSLSFDLSTDESREKASLKRMRILNQFKKERKTCRKKKENKPMNTLWEKYNLKMDIQVGNEDPNLQSKKGIVKGRTGVYLSNIS